MIIYNLAPKDLPSAARVCRQWSEPALDQIWHSIDSLAPLLRLIGPISRGLKDEWEFIEDIQSVDWSRYVFYAPRIRVITPSAPYYLSRVSNQAFQDFVNHIPPHLSLPRPSSINAFTLSPVPVIPLISQSLRKLNVGEVFTHNKRIALNCTMALQAVVSAAAMLDDPCLETLQVASSFSDATLLEALNLCLAKHSSKISTLTARLPFDSQTWDSIFGLPALRTLRIAPFDTNAPRSSEEIVSMIRKLVAKQPLLKSLKLDLPFLTEELQDSFLYSQVIRELMGLRNLETLALSVADTLSLSESDVREMGASWPMIRNLQLHCNSRLLWGIPPWPLKIQTDLSLLPSFLRYLPSLEELHIQFICNRLPPMPQERPPAPAFRVLDLGSSPYPDASDEDVATYLAAILPRSTDVRYRGIRVPGYISRWLWVIDALKFQREESEPMAAEVDI